MSGQYDPEFWEAMKARMMVSYHKYGDVFENYPKHANALDNLRERLEKYHETQNLEWLVDVANFAMIEWMAPSYRNAEMRPTDSDESPGLMLQRGRRTHSKVTEGR